MSKTKPIVPEDYPGLTTKLADVWIAKVVDEVSNEDDDQDELEKTLIYAGAGAGGALVLCCIIYYCVIYCRH